MRNEYKVGLALLSVLIFIIGYCIGEMNIVGFSLNREAGVEINPFDIVSLLFNIVLAYYVVNQLNSKFESDRIIRNTLIEEFDNFAQKIDTNYNEFQSGKVDYHQAAQIFKKMMTRHTELYKWYGETNIDIDAENRDLIFSSLGTSSK